MLQIFLDALVAGIVRNHQQKSVVRLDRLAALFDRQNPPMIRQRMDQHGRVLARLDHFVEIANRAAPHRLRQRTVNPHRLVGLDQEAADQVAAGEILVTGDRDQFVGAVGERRQLMRHVLDEAGLAASGRSLEQHRQARFVSGGEDFHLVANRQVERCRGGVEMAYLGPFGLQPGVEFL